MRQPWICSAQRQRFCTWAPLQSAIARSWDPRVYSSTQTRHINIIISQNIQDVIWIAYVNGFDFKENNRGWGRPIQYILMQELIIIRNTIARREPRIARIYIPSDIWYVLTVNMAPKYPYPYEPMVRIERTKSRRYWHPCATVWFVFDGKKNKSAFRVGDVAMWVDNQLHTMISSLLTNAKWLRRKGTQP